MHNLREETFYSKGTTLLSNKLGKVRVRSHYGNKVGCVLNHRELFDPSDVWFDVIGDEIIDNFGEKVTIVEDNN